MTQPITKAQAQQLSQEFHDVAAAIADYRVDQAVALTDMQQFRLQSLQSECLRYSTQFLTLGLFAQVDDLKESLKVIADGTSKAKEAIGKIKVVDKVLQIAAASAMLGAAIATLDPAALASGVKGLADAIAGKPDTDADSDDDNDGGDDKEDGGSPAATAAVAKSKKKKS